MRIAIFGGRFDPIHNGHLAVAKEVLTTGNADEVWLSIENQHQWRPIVASVEDRKAMVELAIEEASSIIAPLPASGGSKAKQSLSRHPELVSGSHSRLRSNNTFKVDTTPIELGGSTATIFVMRELRKKFPQHTFVFVVGSDNMNVFHKWTHWEELEKEVQFLVIARKGSPIEHVPKNATVIIDSSYEPLDDSATRIRELLGFGKSIHGLVPQSVEEYIIQRKLYQT